MSSHTSCIAREYSEKSDMWSLGMVLYAMCFTSLPFSHDDPHAPWVRKSWVHMSNVGETFYCRAPTGNSWNPIYEFISDSQELIIDFMNSTHFHYGLFSLCSLFCVGFSHPKWDQTPGAEGFDQVLRGRKTLHLCGDRHAGWRGDNDVRWWWSGLFTPWNINEN